jgi:protein-tyrosine phosphatase
MSALSFTRRAGARHLVANSRSCHGSTVRCVGSAPTLFERQVRLDGCFNFRDLGGYPTRGGRRIRSERLYRSDGPHALTASDEVTLRALSLRTVIDLRTADEVSTKPSFVPALPDVVGYHLPLLDVVPNTDHLPTWTDPRVVADRYREMLDRGSEMIAEALGILSEPASYPALIHCTAGKDRTGLLSAIILGLLDATDETILADYVASAAAMVDFVAYLKRAHPAADELLTVLAPAMVSAHPETMTVFIDGILRDFGSFSALTAAIGAGGALRALRASLVV